MLHFLLLEFAVNVLESDVEADERWDVLVNDEDGQTDDEFVEVLYVELVLVPVCL